METPTLQLLSALAAERRESAVDDALADVLKKLRGVAYRGLPFAALDMSELGPFGLAPFVIVALRGMGLTVKVRCGAVVVFWDATGVDAWKASEALVFCRHRKASS